MPATIRKRQRSQSINEVAEANNVHPLTILRMIQRKELEAYRVGRVWRIRADVAEALQHRS